MSAALSLVLFLAAGLAIAWAIVVARTAWIIGHPPRRTYAWAVSRGLPGDPSEMPKPRRFESWTYSSEGPRPWTTPVWTIEGDDPEGPVVIFSHGWGESKEAVLSRLDVLAPRCSKIVAWDLPGHGESTARASPLGTTEGEYLRQLTEYAQGEDTGEQRRRAAELESTLEDAADWDEFYGSPKPGAPRVVLHGFSLGGGVGLCTAMVAGLRVAAVIAESPYRLPWTPAERVMRLRGMPTWCVLRPALWLLGLSRESFRGFDRTGVASLVMCPVLVVHGSIDEICPIEDGRAIAAAAKRGRLEVIEGADHNDLWTTHAEATGRVIGAFLDGLRDRA